jgi:AraC-like DNA-binding protein
MNRRYEVLVITPDRIKFQLRFPKLAHFRTVNEKELVSRLLQTNPPSVVVIDSEVLSPRFAKTLTALSNRRLLVPSILAVWQVNAMQLPAAWELAKLGVHLGTTTDEIEHQIERVERAVGGTPARFLVERLSIECATVQRVLNALSKDQDAPQLSINDLALRCKTTRTTLYNRFDASGLPAAEQVQMLFRLWPAVLDLTRGARIADAAERASLSDTRSLRRALRTRLNTSTKELKSINSTQAVLERWVDLHCLSRDPDSGSRIA